MTFNDTRPAESPHRRPRPWLMLTPPVPCPPQTAMSPPPPFPFYARAKFSYKGTYPEDLVFRKGCVVLVLSVVAEGEWWKARALAEDGTEMDDPEEGNVPMGYFAIIEGVSTLVAICSRSLVALRKADGRWRQMSAMDS